MKNCPIVEHRKASPTAADTVGVIPWVFVFGGGQPLFHSSRVGKQLDFVAVHFYPKKGEISKALQALKAYEVGKPLVIEEVFPLKCTEDELVEFIKESAAHVDGWISFYWGTPAKELLSKDDATIGESITASWLNEFRELRNSDVLPFSNPDRRSNVRDFHESRAVR